MRGSARRSDDIKSEMRYLFPLPVGQRIGGDLRRGIVDVVLGVGILGLPEVAVEQATDDLLATLALKGGTTKEELALIENIRSAKRNKG